MSKAGQDVRPDRVLDADHGRVDMQLRATPHLRQLGDGHPAGPVIDVHPTAEIRPDVRVMPLSIGTTMPGVHRLTADAGSPANRTLRTPSTLACGSQGRSERSWLGSCPVYAAD